MKKQLWQNKPTAFKILFVAFVSVAGFLLSAFSLPKTDFTLTIYAGDSVYVLGYPDIFPSFGELKLNDIDGVVDRIFLDNVIPPVDAEVLFTPDAENIFTYKAEKYGRAPDREKLKKDITLALNERYPFVTAESVTLKPDFTLEKAYASTKERGHFCTFYGTSSRERKKNIELAADKINGLILENGEVFSFNEMVGDRTKENGYLDAKIIKDGKFIDGVGGGVCQVSTTFYNAALLSAVEVTERHAHSVAVGYVSPSFDAAVSYGWYDLKLKNTSGGRLYVKSEADGNNLTFTIFGVENEYEIKRVSEVYKKESPGYEIVEDFSGSLCGDLTEKVLISPKYEITSIGKLLYKSKKDKNQKFFVTLGTDKYRGIKGVIAKRVRRAEVNN